MSLRLNLELLGQVGAARRRRCTAGLPQFLNHHCQIVGAGGSARGERPVAVLLRLCSSGRFVSARGMMNEWRGAPAACSQ